MSKSLKKLIDINRLREFKNKLVGTDSAYVQTGAVDQTVAGTKTFSKPIVGSVTGSSGSCTGNASTATQFSANATVALTGDATGTSAGSKKGWSVPVTLANSGVTAGTYGPSADVTGNNNATISVPQITVDAKGRVTSVTNRTLTCKNNTYSVYNKTLTIQKNGTNVATFTSNSNTDVTANITVPTKVSELTNDSGYLTSHQSLSNYVTLNGAQTITGAKTFGSDVIFNGNYNLRHSADNGYTRIQGGSAEGSGGRLVLSGKTRSANAGCAELYATDGTNNAQLNLWPSGKLSLSGNIETPFETATYLNGNSGKAIINSTATAGAYVTFLKSNSTNGHFTLSSFQGGFNLYYTVGTETGNKVTKSVCLLNENGNSSFPGTVGASSFSGPLTGNVTGNCSGSSGSCTGNAATATKLAAKRTIALSGAATGTATGFDGSGNITIPVTALASSAIRAQWYAAYPDGPEAHNAMWGGRDITAAFDAGTVSANIANGTFKDIFPGDYITKQVTISGTAYTVNWVIADCDYWWHKGDQNNGMETHHVVIVPQAPIFNANMNDTNTTEGGYAGSEMYKNVIPACATGIVSAFGSSHILTFRDGITNSVNTSLISGNNPYWTGATVWWGGFVSVQCNLMCEAMVYDGVRTASSASDNIMATRQMSAFRLSERLINYSRQSWWLRDVVSSAIFASVDGLGYATASDASYVRGVRPFALLK